jgi:formylglycine-generating enzyme required for sulfatase activity/acetyl esterase/lipase
MKMITIHRLPALLPMMLLSGILLADEPANKQKAATQNTKRVPGQPNPRYANDPPPTKKIIYKKIGERELSLHVFEPTGQPTAKRPAIVFFHGGAWAIGNPDQFYYQCDYLAKRGLWAASAEYRLTAPGAGVKIADIVLDAKDAVRYVRSHAGDLGVDPDRIAAAGGSAGGHLAAATAVAPEENPPGAVSGKANLLVLFNPALFYPSAGKTVTLEQFTKDTPPAILFYGTKDDMLQYGMDCLAQSQRLGFPLRLLTAKDAGHSFFNDQPWRDSTLWEADRFLAHHGYLQGSPTVESRPGRWQLDEVKEPILIGTGSGISSPAASEDKPPQKVPVTPDESAAKKQQEDWAAKLKLPMETTNKIGMKLILIPPASAATSKPYYLGKYEVTQREWDEVMGYNPSQYTPKHTKLTGTDTSMFPVEVVSWFDSVEYCNKLSEREGWNPYYELTVTQRGGQDGKQIEAAEVKILGGSGYHIPTGVEWEHGCRAGTTTKYFCGEKDEDLLDYAWSRENSGGRTHAVGEKKPNAFGLYDMHGNVREWNEEMLTNPTTGAPERVTRGGNATNPAATSAVSHRTRYSPASHTKQSYGLRVVRVP